MSEGEEGRRIPRIETDDFVDALDEFVHVAVLHPLGVAISGNDFPALQALEAPPEHDELAMQGAVDGLTDAELGAVLGGTRELCFRLEREVDKRVREIRIEAEPANVVSLHSKHVVGGRHRAPVVAEPALSSRAAQAIGVALIGLFTCAAAVLLIVFFVL